MSELERLIKLAYNEGHSAGIEYGKYRTCTENPYSTEDWSEQRAWERGFDDGLDFLGAGIL